MNITYVILSFFEISFSQNLRSYIFFTENPSFKRCPKYGLKYNKPTSFYSDGYACTANA